MSSGATESPVTPVSSTSSPAEVARVIILGAGASSSTPMLGCLTSAQPCSNCCEAHSQPNSRNHRLNPSLLIQVRRPSSSDAVSSTGASTKKADDSEPHKAVPYSIHEAPVSQRRAHDTPNYLNILVDCGKTFRETSLRHFPALGVSTLHGVLLTHGHADAIYGLDDLREFTGKAVKVPMPVFLDAETDRVTRSSFGYLYPTPGSDTHGRWVAALEWVPFEHGASIPVRVKAPEAVEYANPDDRPVNPPLIDLTLPVTSFPVEHGPGYTCNGFIFETRAETHVLVYLSDISRFNTEDEARLRKAVGGRTIEVLVLDMLSTFKYFSHFSREEALACAATIKAERTYFIGMSHTMAYGKETVLASETLKKNGLVGELGYDGCVVFDILQKN